MKVIFLTEPVVKRLKKEIEMIKISQLRIKNKYKLSQ